MYVGLGSVLAREIPFKFIQFPLYEELKRQVALKKLGDLESWREQAMVTRFRTVARANATNGEKGFVDINSTGYARPMGLRVPRGE